MCQQQDQLYVLIESAHFLFKSDLDALYFADCVARMFDREMHVANYPYLPSEPPLIIRHNLTNLFKTHMDVNGNLHFKDTEVVCSHLYRNGNVIVAECDADERCTNTKEWEVKAKYSFTIYFQIGGSDRIEKLAYPDDYILFALSKDEELA